MIDINKIPPPEETIIKLQQVINSFIQADKESREYTNNKIDALQWKLHKAYERIEELENLLDEELS